MTTIQNIEPSKSTRVKRHRQGDRLWQLWHAGEGRRDILYWEDSRTNQCERIARLQTKSHWELNPNSSCYRKVTVWEMYWYGSCIGTYRGPVEAFKAFINGCVE